MPVCDKCQISFPNYVWVDSVKRNICKRRFCLNCSPFGQNNRKDLTKIQNETKVCKTCKIFKPFADFYVYKSGNKLNPHCKSCMKTRESDRQRKLKSLAVEYKGGCCIVCGYDKCHGALDFHHRDPETKLFSISSKKGHVLSYDIISELDKCDLLCVRCHREIESGFSR